MLNKPKQRSSLSDFLNVDEGCQDSLDNRMKGDELKRSNMGERRSIRRQALFGQTSIHSLSDEGSSFEFGRDRWASCNSMYCYVDEMKKKSKKLRANRRRYRRTDETESITSSQSMQEIDSNVKAPLTSEQNRTEKLKNIASKDDIVMSTSDLTEESSSFSERGRKTAADALRAIRAKRRSGKVDGETSSYSDGDLSSECRMPMTKSNHRSRKNLPETEDCRFLETKAEGLSLSKNKTPSREIPRLDSLRSLAFKLNKQTKRSPNELLSKAAMHAWAIYLLDFDVYSCLSEKCCDNQTL